MKWAACALGTRDRAPQADGISLALCARRASVAVAGVSETCLDNYDESRNTWPITFLEVVTAVMTKRKREIPRLAAGEMEFLQMLWREGGVTIMEAQRA